MFISCKHNTNNKRFVYYTGASQVKNGVVVDKYGNPIQSFKQKQQAAASPLRTATALMPQKPTPQQVAVPVSSKGVSPDPVNLAPQSYQQKYGIQKPIVPQQNWIGNGTPNQSQSIPSPDWIGSAMPNQKYTSSKMSPGNFSMPSPQMNPKPIMPTQVGGNQYMNQPGVTSTPNQGMSASNANNTYDSSFLSKFMNMTPEQQFMAQADAFNAQGKQQMDMMGKMYDTQSQALLDKQKGLEGEMANKGAALDAQNQQDVNKFKADQQPQVDQAIGAVKEAGQERQEQNDLALSFEGFGRSTKRAELTDKVSKDTQFQIGEIERQSNQAVNQYQATLLEKKNRELDKIQARIDKYGDARDQLEFNRIKDQSSLMMDLFKQNPMNPMNMVETAKKLSEIKLNTQKMQLEEKKAIQEKATANFKFMLENYGSKFTGGLEGEALLNYADALGVPPSMIKKVGKTQAEEKEEFERLKYFDSQDFQIALKEMDFDQQVNMFQLGHAADIEKMEQQSGLKLREMAVNQGYDLEKMWTSAGIDMKKMVFGSELEQKKELEKLERLSNNYVAYTGNAAAQDANGLYYGQPTPHNSAATNVVAFNPKFTQKFPQGYTFPAGDPLVGQCAWFAGQVTNVYDLVGKLGSPVAAKRATINRAIQKGVGFKPGQGVPQPGYTVLFDYGTPWGHAGIINAITPDGKGVLTEANAVPGKPRMVTHNRIIDLNAKNIIGFIKSKPKAEYQMQGSPGGKLGANPAYPPANDKAKIAQGGSLPNIGAFLGNLGQGIASLIAPKNLNQAGSNLAKLGGAAAKLPFNPIGAISSLSSLFGSQGKLSQTSKPDFNSYLSDANQGAQNAQDQTMGMMEDYSQPQQQFYGGYQGGMSPMQMAMQSGQLDAATKNKMFEYAMEAAKAGNPQAMYDMQAMLGDMAIGGQQQQQYDMNKYMQQKSVDSMYKMQDSAMQNAFNQTKYKPPSDMQLMTSGYAKSLQSANNNLSNFDSYIQKLNPADFQWQKSAPNFMKSPEMQQIEQSQRQFINSLLRRESGANITPSEFDSYGQQFFPQPGDHPAVIQQKKSNRELAIQSMQYAAGPSYSNNDSDPLALGFSSGGYSGGGGDPLGLF